MSSFACQTPAEAFPKACGIPELGLDATASLIEIVGDRVAEVGAVEIVGVPVARQSRVPVRERLMTRSERVGKVVVPAVVGVPVVRLAEIVGVPVVAHRPELAGRYL